MLFLEIAVVILGLSASRPLGISLRPVLAFLEQA